jgi:KamA family protein
MHCLKFARDRDRMVSTDLKYKPITIHNFRQLSQLRKFSEEQLFDMEVVAHVFPFRSNNYVVKELIDWDAVPNDPLFILTFPQKKMLRLHHFKKMAAVLQTKASPKKILDTANEIRCELNPHPAGQLEKNIPMLDGRKLHGMQHKYQETVLFFPSQGQSCHAYCSFCFRWPQFVGVQGLKFASRETEELVNYVRQHPEISDVLFTGGDPLVMRTSVLAAYLQPLLDAKIPHLNSIRIGTKALGYWPYRFLTDPDAQELLNLFRKISQAGKHLAIMAHFNHPHELATPAVREAIARIRETGAQIRTQSPLLAHINDRPEIWTKMWQEQVRLGCIPYYMFVVRDTGAQHYFGLTLARAKAIFNQAYQKVSGLARTVRGPSMSANPGKIQILGIHEINGEPVFSLRFLQGRNPDWVQKPFFAKFDKNAIWLDDLIPAFGEKQFFYEIENN